MTAKIKLSYTKPYELEGVVESLGAVVKKYKISKSEQGEFKKAYIELDYSDRAPINLKNDT